MTDGIFKGSHQSAHLNEKNIIIIGIFDQIIQYEMEDYACSNFVVTMKLDQHAVFQ